MKSYGQACGLAKALDVVGDRWTLLIVRELLTRGACRYTDLRRGLPGIATNLLAERLKELETAGLVTRSYAPPPVATDLFSLTRRGRDLEPALLLLGRWGAPLLAEAAPDEPFQAHWMVLPLRSLLRSGGAARVEVRSEGERVAILSKDGAIDVRLGTLQNPLTVVEGPARPVFDRLVGKLGAAGAAKAGVRVSGDRAALGALIPARPARRSAND